MNRKEKARTWLTEDVYPLWLTKGIDPQSGAFHECLNDQGQPQSAPRRAMVQCRQMYAFNEAGKLEILKSDQVKQILRKASDNFLGAYSDPTGGFIHAVNEEGQPTNKQMDLYTQAFALFGLAQAYEVLNDPKIKARALELIDYLQTHRRAPAGGFTETLKGETLYQSNPHMHLFEGLIAWTKIDHNPMWKDLADKILDLCQSKFIDNEAGVVCEHFDSNWSPKRDNGLFHWEPGHQCEWAWLMLEMGTSKDIPQKIYSACEKQGVKNGKTLDEIWSNGTPKTKSSRFWPQSERIKAAVALGDDRAADQAFDALFKFFKGGLWEDQILENGEFKKQPVKASSLYHIVNALSEYINKR